MKVRLAVLLLLFLAVPIGIGAQREFGERPKLRSAEELIPASVADSGEEVLLLDLLIESKEGEVMSVTLENPAIITSFAPKVFARSRGDWTIRLDGDSPVEYQVVNPVWDVEYERIEGDDNVAEQPFGYEIVSEPFTWELTVPLFKDGKDLGVKTVTILGETGEEIFAVEIDRAGWRE